MMKGVSFDSTNKKYKAYINFKGKRYYLGSYSSFEPARTARLFAESLYSSYSSDLQSFLCSKGVDKNLTQNLLINAFIYYMGEPQQQNFSSFVMQNYNDINASKAKYDIYKNLNEEEIKILNLFMLKGYTYQMIGDELLYTKSTICKKMFQIVEKCRR